MVNHFAIALALATAAGLVAGSPTPSTEIHSGRYAPPPAGTADGTYLVSLNDDGTTHYEFIAAHTVNETDATSKLAARKTGSGCNNYDMNAADLGNAENGLVAFCGQGHQWSGKSISQVYGTAVVFGCNYGNNQRCDGDTVRSYFNNIDRDCGYAAAGFWSQENDKVSYGRVSTGGGYC
jgi:hypothetical protein